MRIDTFVKKAMGKVDAATFLAEHRNYLHGFRAILPVLALLEKGVLFPTQVLTQVLQLIVLEKDPTEKTEEKVDTRTGVVKNLTLAQVEKITKQREPKKYQIFIIVGDGPNHERILDEVYSADEYGAASRLAHRKLFHREDSLRAEIIGLGVSTMITRVVAMKEILAGSLGGNQSTKKMAKTSSSLGWRCSAKGFTAKFSRG